MSWEDFFEHAPAILQAVSIAVTAVFAIIGLNAWRRQLIGRRRFEVAEQIPVKPFEKVTEAGIIAPFTR